MSAKNFAQRLIAQIRANRSIVCIGLDPRIGGKSCIPQWILEEHNNDHDTAIWHFNREIIDATSSYAAIYKPQIAFYEQYNALGALQKTIDHIHSKGGLVLLDAKRNDIGSTASAYAEAIFNRMQADAVTINGYLGIDGVKPFLNFIPEGKGVIILLKTSNPSSGDFQDLFSVGIPDLSAEIMETTEYPVNRPLVRNYIQMTRLMQKWTQEYEKIQNSQEYSSIGGVVGATYPIQLQAIRNEAPNNFILIPGYGAQGGTAKDIVHGVNSDGLGAIVNASRSINFAYQNEKYKEIYSAEQFAEAAKQATNDMREDLNNALEKAGKLHH